MNDGWTEIYQENKVKYKRHHYWAFSSQAQMGTTDIFPLKTYEY
jgi:hypothetical protein